MGNSWNNSEFVFLLLLIELFNLACSSRLKPSISSYDGCERQKVVYEQIILIDGEYTPNEKNYTRSYHPTIQKIKALMQENSTWQLVIDGHAPKLALPELEVKMALESAEKMKSALVSTGINYGRIKTYTLGSDMPRFDPDSTSENHRLEIQLYKIIGHVCTTI